MEVASIDFGLYGSKLSRKNFLQPSAVFVVFLFWIFSEKFEAQNLRTARRWRPNIVYDFRLRFLIGFVFFVLFLQLHMATNFRFRQTKIKNPKFDVKMEERFWHVPIGTGIFFFFFFGQFCFKFEWFSAPYLIRIWRNYDKNARILL